MSAHSSFYIKTFGCKVNQYESQLIYEELLNLGFKETKLQECNYIIVNSCTVTADADKGLRKFIHSARRINPSAEVIVVGCYPHKFKDKFLPGVNKMLDNFQKYSLGNYLKGGKVFSEQMPSQKITGFKSHTRAFLKVQDGCDNRCSYCCIWQARGSSRSRSLQDIIEEAKGLIARGYHELVLTGVCLGSYGRDLSPALSLNDVIEALERLDGEFRIRLSSLDPQYITEGLISRIRSSSRICPYLHIPLQSGSEKILRLMRRGYDVGEVREIITKLRKIKNFEFSVDVMVGFPQEDEYDFNSTVELLQELAPIRVHVFPFSPRPGTAAEKLDGRLPSKIIKERKQFLIKISWEIIKKQLSRYFGKDLMVLSEGKGWGYSENYIKVGFLTPVEENKFYSVRIKKLNPSLPGLDGEIR